MSLLNDEREKYGIGGAAKLLSKLTNKLIAKHQKRLAKEPVDSIDNTRYFDYNDAARMLEEGDITIAQANQMLKQAGYPEADVQEFTRAYSGLAFDKAPKSKLIKNDKETDLEKEMRPMTDKEKEDALDDLMDEFNEGGRVQAKDGGPKSKLKPIPEDNKGLPNLPEEVRNDMGYFADGGNVDNQMSKLMESDEEMEDNYIDFILDEALTEEEEDMLMSKLEQDEQLSMVFDKVIEVASEFAGSGPVEGPGTGVSDSIPARLSDGEFVFTAKAVKEIGADELMRMMKDAEMKADKRQGMANGGDPEEERVELPVEEQKEPPVRIVKETVDSMKGLEDEDEIAKAINTKLLLDNREGRHVQS